jgi:CO/xanthine dehydrogenase Mo-binding subunit
MSVDVAFDEVAEKLGIDPIQIRLKNAVLPNEVVPSKATVTSTGLSESIVMYRESQLEKKRGKLSRTGIGIGSGNYAVHVLHGIRTVPPRS